MNIISRLEDICLPYGERTCITLGKFDGIHLGHQKLFRTMAQVAQSCEKRVVFTFDFNIRGVLTGKTVQNLFSTSEKRELLEKQGVDLLIECPFTDEIRMMEPEVFVKKILLERLHAASIIIGDDFHFGYRRAGDAALLEKLSSDYGYVFYHIEKEKDGAGVEIGSTRIREELIRGELEHVHELLGFPYFVEGEVVHGNHLGQRIGSPTINQRPGSEKLLPPFGVYYSKVHVGDHIYPGVTNIGYKPTVSDDKVVGVETYLLDFSGDIYEQRVRTDLYHYARPERVFDSVQALANCIQQDIANAEAYWKAGD